MTTPLLILMSLILPTAWGCLTESVLRRIWRREEMSPSTKTDDRETAVDFQI